MSGKTARRARKNATTPSNEDWKDFTDAINRLPEFTKDDCTSFLMGYGGYNHEQAKMLSDALYKWADRLAEETVAEIYARGA
jgi:hypothetical protein